MHPFGSAPLLDLDDDGDVDISHGGVVDRRTAAADDVVLWDDDAAIACTIVAVPVRGGRITILSVPAAAA